MIFSTTALPARGMNLMLCQDCLQVRPYCESGHFGDYRCHCGGDFCGCNSCNEFARGQGPDFENRQVLEATVEKPESIPAPAAPRELRLLCVLDIFSPIDHPRYIPAGTMHRLSPRTSVQGRWSLEGDAFYQLRSAHPKCPTAKVLVRCYRHWQANAFRSSPGAIRIGRVIS